MKTPVIDLVELRAQKEENFRERLKFIDQYVDWLKKTPNKTWSRQQKAVIDQQKA
jgi:hypothetical protein